MVRETFSRAAVLAPAYRLEVIHALAPLQPRQDLPLFFLPVCRNHDHDRLPDRFRGRIAVKALRPAVPAGDLPGEILADDGVIRGIDDGAEQQPRLFGFPALGDVTRNAKLDDRAVGAAQRHGMRFHPAALALQADDVEFEGALLATADALVEGAERFAVFRRDEIINASAGHLFRRGGADHLQPRLIHQQQRSVGGDHLDALGRRLDNRPETLFASAQYILGALALGDIDQHIDRAGQTALIVE